MRYIKLLVFTLLLTQIAFSQELKVPTLSPISEVVQEVALTSVKLVYSRPGAKGRKVFGDLVPFGEVWRTGANASTKLTFSEDVSIEGNALKAGTYALYTIPGENDWTIIIHKNSTLRALSGDVYKPADDAFRFKVKPEKTAEFIETFKIEFEGIATDSCFLTLSWENTKVRFRINFDVNNQLDAQIAELQKSTDGMSAGDYFRAAEYYFHNGRDLEKAIGWITTALQKTPKNARFGLLHAKILAGQGKIDDALKVIAAANGWARDENNSNYIEQTQLFWDSIKK